MQFKTNAINEDSALAIKSKVQKSFPNAKLNMDLESEDKVLHVHGIPENIESAAIIERNIEEAGFKGAWLENGVNNL